jgi:hypothetical protein
MSAMTQLIRYYVTRVERTTSGELVVMERYAAKTPASAVERARLVAGEGAGAVAHWEGERAGSLPNTKEILAVFGLQPEDAKRLVSPPPAWPVEPIRMRAATASLNGPSNRHRPATRRR